MNDNIPLLKFWCQTVIPLVYDDSLSYYESLCKVTKSLNDTITKVNQLNDIVENIDVNFTDIYNKIQEINTQISDLNNYFEIFRDQINAYVQNQLTIYNDNIVQLMQDYQNIFNNNLNEFKNEVNEKIEKIELGEVNAYNPTNGKTENVSKVISDVYNSLRSNAITAIEYDNLGLTATAYDSKEITAINYDLSGKLILMPSV